MASDLIDKDRIYLLKGFNFTFVQTFLLRKIKRQSCIKDKYIRVSMSGFNIKC